MQPMKRFTSGNCQILRLAQKHVVVAFKVDMQYVINASKELSMINFVGKMLKIRNQRKSLERVMTKRVLLIGGLARGNLAQLLANDSVSCFFFCFHKLKFISLQ
jgi:hypothetical protein